MIQLRTMCLVPAGLLLLAAGCTDPGGARSATADASAVVESRAATDGAGSVDSATVALLETFGSTFSVVRLDPAHEGREFQVRVGDTVLFRDSVSQTVGVHTFTEASGRSLVLLHLFSGGTGCPAMYRIVELAGDREPAVTPEFGNCSDIPVVLLDEGRLRVRFPGFWHARDERQPGFRPPPPSLYEYQGEGRVRLVSGPG